MYYYYCYLSILRGKISGILLYKTCCRLGRQDWQIEKKNRIIITKTREKRVGSVYISFASKYITRTCISDLPSRIIYNRIMIIVHAR